MNKQLPRCAGMSWLYDSTRLHDHYRARRLCDECPVTRECMRQALRVASGTGQTPDGTWAGVLWRDGHIVPPTNKVA